MSDLYTSQVHLKRVLAGQATAAFTPLPSEVAALIDPAFVPGMGALNEDAEGRLQCPMRGCGTFHSDLGAHVGASHRELKAQGIRRLLGIPQTVGLSTRRHPSKKGCSKSHMDRMRTLRTGVRKQVSGLTAMSRNKADTCPAQLQAKLIALAEKLGHSPSMADFDAEYDGGSKAAVSVFGTWQNAKNIAGLGASVGGPDPIVPQEQVVEALRAWHEVHGDLPTSTECKLREKAPILPTYPVILRSLSCLNWQSAMRAVLSILNVESERYGYLRDERDRMSEAA